ncbi:aminotransferase class I/II-fold pyridoxal phosphate-dependent enzyme [Staphylococcus chromogenes]|nr:aminotransferase class I/II-fold pyridoxal phosphate-dependent enzyme [Staphylococcus chromogenes]
MTVARLNEFGETIFATMSAEAAKYDAINLGQGFPDSDGPAAMLRIAQEEIARGNNQYSPILGLPELREAVAIDRVVSPDNVLVTVGATEALTASILGHVEPGAEVIVLEPYYDAYAAAIALAGAKRVAVPLKAVGNTWDVDVAAVAAAVTSKTAMIIVNSPHNPTGAVFSRKALEELAQLCVGHDLLVLSDEVYEKLTFGSAQHTRIADLPGMWLRTITVSSAAKTFSCTGWKTGWAVASRDLLDGVVKAKQFMTFVGATPFQPAVAYALRQEREWVQGLVADLDRKRNLLADGLRTCGYHVHDSAGTYFVVADVGMDGVRYCQELPQRAGVAAIPLSALTDHPDQWSTKVRFAFCKNEKVLAQAIHKLRGQAK